MAWVPRSERLSGTTRGPFEGVPPHMEGPLLEWLRDCVYDGYDWHVEVMRSIAMRLSIPVPADLGDYEVFYRLKDACIKDETVFFDVAEGALFAMSLLQNDKQIDRLRSTLALCGSTLTVNKEGNALVEAVGQEAQEIYDSATSVEDERTTDLREAWINAYGRSPDPSDAWDHAIKAVEHVLVPVVQPNNAKATLGNVLGVLGSAASTAQWEMVLPGSDLTNDVGPLVAMLRLLWPNPDRHGGSSAPREPKLEEAKAAATLAAMIVQWERQGWVVRRR